MAIEDALRSLNSLKRRRVIRDYAIMGGVAAAAYMEPMFTEDVDVLILVDSDEEFISKPSPPLSPSPTGRGGGYKKLGDTPKPLPEGLRPSGLPQQRVSKRARDVEAVADQIEDMHHVIAGTPVQLFPTTVSSFYNDALASARPVRVGNLRTKVVAAEHLILMFLQAFRPKDRIRVSALLQEADEVRLRQLLQRFDDEKGTLAHRLENIRESGVSREGRI